MFEIYGSKLTGPFEKIFDQFGPSGQQTKRPVDPWLETVFISGHFELLVTDFNIAAGSNILNNSLNCHQNQYRPDGSTEK